ncbi:hypothetical protein GCM10025870_18800 [Agromyces marinus]|uniref:protein-tyrosine-phosphatase n=1 Tax=Agromyces marinus TaxID=1389020 RepID=A0ABN6YBQ1_9MICO|nr:hypothetical protein GCM10025870_18800 [Agromyces marinus]
MTRADAVVDSAQRFRVSFVCTGNICRSPMAEAVLRSLADRAGLADRLEIESAATGTGTSASRPTAGRSRPWSGPATTAAVTGPASSTRPTSCAST